MIQDTDIVYVLSGGASNTNPEASLGGDPSAAPVLNGTNNLFSNVTPAVADEGGVDYRCFYVFNNSLVDTLWNAKIYPGNEIDGGAFAELGFVFADEIQKLTVIGNVTGGSLTLSYEDTNFSFAYNSNLGTWAANLQGAMRSIAALAGVVVTAEQSVNESSQTTTVFTILYTGNAAGKRFQPILDVVANSLTPTPIVSAARVVGGSPINSIATLIDFGTTAPTGIVFTTLTEDEPAAIGHLRPTDGFPVWVRRTTPPATQPLAGDGFFAVCTGTAFE